MGDVVVLPVIRIERYHDDTPSDGGKARIRARRELIGLAKQGGQIVQPESLVMLRPDPELPCDCA
jgi:hypothetical protein